MIDNLIPNDAAREALDLLTSAGVTPSTPDERAWGDAVAGSPATLQDVAGMLVAHLAVADAKVARETAEREALEMDAAELYATFYGMDWGGSFDKMPERAKQAWVNVAQRARELRGSTS